MKPCLVDVNVWLALLVERHEHHRTAARWFDRLEAGEARLCRLVQLSVVRLLGNPAILGSDAVGLSTGWGMLQELLTDERVEYVEEPRGLDEALPALFRYRRPSGKLLADAYLAAFAECSGLGLVTFDAGFREYPGTEVQLLRHAGKTR